MNKFNVIYCDPPWKYNKSGGMKNSRGLAKKYYKEMAIEDIKSLPVSDICSDNCYLFLWVTAPCMQEGLDVLKAWGFKFSTVAFTWIKKNKISDSLFWGMGNITRANPEYVLLGRRGKLDRDARNIHSVVMSKIQEHSKKPEEVRKRIELLYPLSIKLEMFSRNQVVGWYAMGDAINGKDIRDELIELKKSILLGENNNGHV